MNFVKSRDFAQLRAATTKPTKCGGALTNEEIFDFNPKLYKSYNGTPLNGSHIARPCGLHAKAYFNDTFELYQGFTGDNSHNISISDYNIANKFDKEYVFKKFANASLNDWIDTTSGN